MTKFRCVVSCSIALSLGTYVAVALAAPPAPPPASPAKPPAPAMKPVVSTNAKPASAKPANANVASVTVANPSAFPRARETITLSGNELSRLAAGLELKKALVVDAAGQPVLSQL